MAAGLFITSLEISVKIQECGTMMRGANDATRPESLKLGLISNNGYPESAIGAMVRTFTDSASKRSNEGVKMEYEKPLTEKQITNQLVYKTRPRKKRKPKPEPVLHTCSQCEQKTLKLELFKGQKMCSDCMLNYGKVSEVPNYYGGSSLGFEHAQRG